MTSSSPCLPRAGLPRRSGRAKAGPIPSPKITIQPANSTIPWITLRLPSPACYHSPWLLDSRPIGPTACPPWRAPRASIPTTGQIVCKLVTLRTPTDARIPFLFNHSLSLRLRRRPTRSRLSPLFPPPCGRFSSQRMGTPPPLPTAFSAKIRTERFRRRGLIFHRAPSFASSFQKSLAYRRFQPVGEDLAAHELPVTSSPRAESRGQK
jgi:hypothetical protein